MDTNPADSQLKVDSLWGNIFAKFGFHKDNSRHQIIKNIPIFNQLSNREIKSVHRIIYEREYSPGEYVFESGQPGAAMFVIEEGEIEIIRCDKSGKEIVLAVLGNGEFFGELAMLDNSPRSASARAGKSSKVLSIFREDLDKLIKTDTELGVKVLKKFAVLIGMRLKTANDLLVKYESSKIEKAYDSNKS